MDFYLGTHEPSWLSRVDIPLFVSHRRLQRLRRLPVAKGRWALDSGGFTELAMFGEWHQTAASYAASVAEYAEWIGGLEWAAPQDYMCEPFILAKTGLTVREHQRRTVRNYLDLRMLEPGLPFVPVLQGWVLEDYLEHVRMYAQAGVQLAEVDRVGLGSVCRRQATHEIASITATLSGLDIPLHGFGVKTRGLARYGRYLVSSDSMAWSYDARRSPPLPHCHSHKNCANCLHYALGWRQRLLDGMKGD